MGAYFEDLRVGDEFTTPGRTIGEADVLLFSGLTGDHNPLHTDAEFARTGPFGRRIAHGLLGLAVAVGLSSRLSLFEGTGIAFLGLEWRFVKPIFFGDTLRVKFAVQEKKETGKPDRGVLVLATEVLNQEGEVVQRGMRSYLVRRRPGAEGEPPR